MYEFKVGDVVICDKYSTPRKSNIPEDEDIQHGGKGWSENRIFRINRLGAKCSNGRYILWSKEGGVWNTHVSLYKKKIKEYGISKFMNSLNKK